MLYTISNVNIQFTYSYIYILDESLKDLGSRIGSDRKSNA